MTPTMTKTPTTPATETVTVPPAHPKAAPLTPADAEAHKADQSKADATKADGITLGELLLAGRQTAKALSSARRLWLAGLKHGEAAVQLSAVHEAEARLQAVALSIASLPTGTSHKGANVGSVRGELFGPMSRKEYKAVNDTAFGLIVS